MKRKLVLIRHGDGPSDDRVVNWASLNEIEIEVFKPFRGEVIPDLHETTIGTVIYGGKYEAYAIKEFPFLKNEYSWIEKCLTSNTPMLGICQGAQQIAHHLGAKVGPVDNSDYIGGNYVTAINLSTNLPGILNTVENVDFSYFIDVANVWGVDYSSSIDDSNKIRSSTGIGVDFLTPIGTLSFSLSQTLTKNSTDKTESFRFNLGTTF